MPGHKNKKSAPRAKSPTDIGSRFASVSNELDRVREFIAKQLSESIVPAGGLIEHIPSVCDDMVRSAIVLLAGAACGSITDAHVQIAAIIEMANTAMVLHAGVIDEIKEQVNTQYEGLCDNESAVLLGDFLLSKVFVICTNLQPPQTAEILADTAIQLCRGELMENTQRQSAQPSEEEYLEITNDRSASLFRTACYLGALAAGGNEDRCSSLAEFGSNVGMAFQITKDKAGRNAMAEKFRDRAIESLDVLDDSSARGALIEIAEFITA